MTSSAMRSPAMRYTETPAKVLVLDQLLQEVMARSSTQKAIVWTSFVGNIPMLRARYLQYRPVTFHGEMDAEERKLFDASVEHVRSLVEQIAL